MVGEASVRYLASMNSALSARKSLIAAGEIVRRDGRDAAAITTYTDTYVYERGAWQCIQAQITPVAPDQEPGDDTIVSTYINGVLTK